MTSLFHNLRVFWFAPESPHRLAAVRAAFGVIWLWDAVWRWPYAVEIYSTAGAPLLAFPGTWLAVPIPGPELAVGLQSSLIVLWAAVAVGWQTRVSLVLAGTMTTWLALLDAPTTLAKYTVVTLHVVLLLALSRCGDVGSVDARLARRPMCPLGPAWPRRLLQVLVCAIYWGAAVTKLQAPDFLTGDLLMYNLLDDRFGGTAWGQALAGRHALVRLAAWGSLAFEIAFPLLVWGRLRLVMLVLACAFHLGMALCLVLGPFPWVMLATLLAFAGGGWWVVGGGGEEAEPATGRRWASSVLYVACVVAALGVGPLAAGRLMPPEAEFAEVPRESALTMLSQPRLPEAAYLLRAELGTRLQGRQVFGDDSVFRRGDHVCVLVQLLLPHPRYQWEGILLAPTGDEVARFAQWIEPGEAYGTTRIELTDTLPAGEYVLLLQLNGYEVGRRTFEVRP